MGRTITMYPCGEDDFPFEKGHKKTCSQHPAIKHPNEWKKRRRGRK